ncbi:MAG: hypothetical protein AMXMBFR84_40550 [Candidatus Hydrogenedentota bacterium]
MPRLSLHSMIFAGMFIGLGVGLVVHYAIDPESNSFQTLVWWLNLFGKELFIGGLKMIIAPLIFSTVIAGISSLPAASDLGSIGFKTFAYYFSTTAIAVGIGIAAVLFVQPGAKEASQSVRADRERIIAQYREEFTLAHGGDPNSPQFKASFKAYMAERDGLAVQSTDFRSGYERMAHAKDRTPGQMVLEDIIRPILSNPFHAISQNPPNSLGIIAFAILTGVACIVLGDKAKPVAAFFTSMSEIMMIITLWIMRLAPLAIACLIASMVATFGVDSLISLGWYCGVVIGGIAVHVGVLLTLVALVGRMNPIRFVKGIWNAWIIAFTTTSSAATLPVTIHSVKKKLGVSEKVADFSLPVGATINMDGTALYEGVAVIFLIQMYGGLEDVPITMGPVQTLVIFVTAVLASVGAAAVPSAGLITMAIVATAVGLPIHYVVIIYAVDHFLDMFRTSTNVLGDMAGAVIIDRLESGRLARKHTA